MRGIPLDDNDELKVYIEYMGGDITFLGEGNFVMANKSKEPTG